MKGLTDNRVWLLFQGRQHACSDRAQLMAPTSGRHRTGGRPTLQEGDGTLFN